MAELKRSYNIPLRKEFMKVPKYKRSKKAVKALKEFVAKHMKIEKVNILEELNEHIWKNGIKNPPHHVKVDILKKDDVAYVQLQGIEIKIGTEEKPKATEKVKEKIKENAKTEAKKVADKVVKEEEKKEKPKKTTKKEEPTKEEPKVEKENK